MAQSELISTNIGQIKDRVKKQKNTTNTKKLVLTNKTNRI